MKKALLILLAYGPCAPAAHESDVHAGALKTARRGAGGVVAARDVLTVSRGPLF